MSQKPYIAYELDALKLVPDIARGTGTQEHVVGYGLLRLWSYCWERKADRVGDIHLCSFFAGATGMGPALVAFGFLEAVGAEYRVRGAERYLRLSEARSKGGKAAAKNLIPGAKHRKVSPEAASATAESQPKGSREAAESQPKVSREQPMESSRLTIGSTPNTEHRTPNTSKTPLPPTHDSAQPVFVEKVQMVFIEERGTGYSPHRFDEAAGRALLAKADETELLRRWRIGLRTKFPACHCLSDLLKNWNAYAIEHVPPAPQFAGKPQRNHRTGDERAATPGQICMSCEKAEGVRDSYGTWMCGPCADHSDAFWKQQGGAA